MLQLPQLTWRASPNYSSRGGQRVRLFVVHDCEGSFDGSISWFAQTRSRVSAHVVLSGDGTRAVQMVDWRNKAWHACDFNPISESLEMEGFAEKGFGSAEWQAAANIVAFRLRANKIPPVWAAGGMGEGFCSHYDLGQHGGGHSDPTTSPAVWNPFVKMVQSAYREAIMPTLWVPGLASVAPPAPANWMPSNTARHDIEIGTLEWVQMELNALGIPPSPLTVDGLDGPNTRQAVRLFQTKYGLSVDGDAGPLTVAKMKIVLA